MLVLGFLLCSINPGDISNSILDRPVITITHQFSRIVPHLTRSDGGFTSRILMENRSCFETRVFLRPYDESGTILEDTVEVTVPAQSVKAYAPSELFENGEGVSHFDVIEFGGNPDQYNVTVSVSYTRDGVDSVPARALELRERGTLWNVFPGNWNRTFDGLAIVNTRGEPAVVDIEQVGFDGTVIETHRIADALPGSGKILYVLSDGDFEPREDVAYRIRATEEIAVLALRGDNDGMMWVNAATVLEAPSPAILSFDLATEGVVDSPLTFNIDYEGSQLMLFVKRDNDGSFFGFEAGFQLSEFYLTFLAAGEYRVALMIIAPDGRRTVDYKTVVIAESAVPTKTNVVSETPSFESVRNEHSETLTVWRQNPLSD